MAKTPGARSTFKTGPQIGLIMGSVSDWKTMSAAAALLEEFGVAYEKNVVPYVLPDGRKIAARAIPYLMTRGFNDPRFMPVTRDLSPDKVLHILTYIADIQAGVQPTPPPPGSST